MGEDSESRFTEEQIKQLLFQDAVSVDVTCGHQCLEGLTIQLQAGSISYKECSQPASHALEGRDVELITIGIMV